MQGSSAATENPANSLRSLLASFASGHEDDDEDVNSRQTERSQAEKAPPQRAKGPRIFGGGQKRNATSASVGGVSASKTSRAEGVLEEGATAGEMFSIWNLLGPFYIEGG